MTKRESVKTEKRIQEWMNDMLLTVNGKRVNKGVDHTANSFLDQKPLIQPL